MNKTKVKTNNFHRQSIEIADLVVTRRMGRDLNGKYTIYIGLVGNGAELNQDEVKAILPYLRKFAKDGILVKK